MLRFFIALLVLGLSFSIQAQDESPADKDVIYKIDVVEGESVQDIIEKSHTLIEGDESGRFLQDWKEAVNFKKKAVEAVRYVSASQNPVVFDSLLLFGMSHSLETSSGPIFLGLGISNGWNEWLTTALTVGGGIISVPGLDPLCIVLFAIYYKSPQFRSAVGKVRMAIVYTVNGVGTVTGVKALLKKTLARPDYQEWLSQIEHLDEIRTLRDGRLIAQYSYPSIEDAQLKIEVEVGETRRPYVKRVFVNKDISVTSAQLSQKWLKSLGWNTRDLINKFVLDNVIFNHHTEKAYVKGVTEDGAWRVVELLDHAVGMGPRVALAKKPKEEKPVGYCRQLFALPFNPAILGIIPAQLQNPSPE